MASIQITDLNMSAEGANTHKDSFFHNLSDEQTQQIIGGGIFLTVAGLTLAGATLGYEIGKDYRRQEQSKAGNACYA